MQLSSSSAGVEIHPVAATTEDDPSFGKAAFQEALGFYRQNGYTVFRNLIAKELCEKVRISFATEVKPYGGPLPRINGQDEVNRFNERGFLVNSLMNVQRKSRRIVPGYVADVLAVLTHQDLKDVVEAFFTHRVGLMTWNHIEANPVTQPHCDCHFWAQDMAFGEIMGAWIALEDIHPDAGRLYVYPHSHSVDMKDFLASSGRAAEIIRPQNPHHQRAILEMVKSQGWTCTAPVLKAGDVLLWDSRVIHGSLATTSPEYSRSSLTSHFSSVAGRFIKARSRRTPVNGVAVPYPNFRLKDLLTVFNR